jgi:hypothetical protein
LKRKTTTRIAVLLVSLGVLGIAIHEGVPRLIDKNAIKLAIQDGLHKSTGVNFTIKDLTLEPTLFHGIQVHLNTSTITDMRKNPLGSIENITVQIRYLPLLTEQLPEIAKIHLNHVRIPVGKYNFFKEIKLKLVKPKRTGFLKPAELHDAEVLLTDYLIEDVLPSTMSRRLVPNAKSFRVEGDEISIRHLESKKPVSVLGNGALAYLINPPPVHPRQKASQGTIDPNAYRYHLGTYRIFVEVPQAAIKKGNMAADALGRLEVKLDGPRLNLDLAYQHKQDKDALGNVSANRLDLRTAQTVAMQVRDTFGLPLPPQLGQYLLAGKASLDDTRFQLAFSKPNMPDLRSADGAIRLENLAIAPPTNWKSPMVECINGRINLKGRSILISGLDFQLQNLPLHLRGSYHLDSQKVDALLTGKSLRVTSLQHMAGSFGTGPNPLQGRNITGLLDIYTHVTGTASLPVYTGRVTIRDGSFEDASQGLLANHVNGQVNFRGKGLQKPTVHYNGNLDVNNGKLIVEKQGLRVNRFDGQVAFQGQVTPDSQTPALPSYNGQINVQDAQYQDPKTKLLVDRIQGVLKLGGDLVSIERFKGWLGGSLFTASGTVKPNLVQPMQSQYQVRVQSQQVNLKNFKNQVLVKLPNAQPLLAQLDPYSGHARVDVTASTGMQLNGRVDVAALAVRTPDNPTHLKVPALSVLFNNRSVRIPNTRIYYGDLAVNLAGQFQQPNAYRFQLATEEIPVSFLRDQSELMRTLSGSDLPEIWNTAGSLKANGVISNRGKDIALSFNNAGLSWQGGDFPVYDLNGSLKYQQVGNGKPLISSNDLRLRYGNSPINVSVTNQAEFSAKTEGVLSPLLVNHFLVSHQTEATPYKEVPFTATAAGFLAGLPDSPKAAQNNVRAEVFLDLDPNLKAAYSGPVKAEAPPSAEESTQSATASVEEPASNEDGSKKAAFPISLNPIKTTGQVIGIAKQTIRTGSQIITTPLSKLQQLSQEIVANAKPEAEAPALPEVPITQLAVADTSTANLSANLHWQGHDLQLEKGVLHLFDSGDIVADGYFKDVLKIGQRAFLVHVVTTPGVDLAKLSQGTPQNEFFKGATGNFKADVQFAANSAGVKLGSGFINADKLSIPFLTLRDLSGNVDIDGETATATISRFEVPGVSANVSARSANIFEHPISLEDVKIRGGLVSIESLGDFNSQIVRPILVDQLAHSFLRPWQQGDPTSPVQFRNADLAVDEVIFQNIIMNTLTSQLSLYANSLMELSNTQVQTAGGRASGYLSMSPNDYNFMTLELNVENVKANALTKALLNTTNQIFGDVNGTVRFTTYGQDDMQMQKNANGTVSMKVTNGRLPAIAKVETLLTTANILRGGILGLNLNNLFRTLMFYDTNYFAELSGDMLIANQVLYTENLTSDGVNLDLLIQGSLKMDNGNANMLVTGRMSQDVAGLFGKVGQLSLGRLVRVIPGIGSFGKNQSGLLGYIPGVGYVPGFGGPAGQYNRFQVRLVGSLEDPGAIQDFHWIR